MTQNENKSSTRLNEDYKKMQGKHAKQASTDNKFAAGIAAAGAVIMVCGALALSPENAEKVSSSGAAIWVGAAIDVIAAGYATVKALSRRNKRRSLENDIDAAEQREIAENGISDLAKQRQNFYNITMR